MRLPRDVSGEKLVTRLARLGYRRGRQRGSHLTVVTEQNGRHSLHVPMHKPIKPGMLSALLKDAAEHHGISPDELVDLLGL